MGLPLGMLSGSYRDSLEGALNTIKFLDYTQQKDKTYNVNFFIPWRVLPHFFMGRPCKKEELRKVHMVNVVEKVITETT